MASAYKQKNVASKSKPRTPKPTGVTKENGIKVKVKADMPSKFTTSTPKSRNQPYY